MFEFIKQFLGGGLVDKVEGQLKTLEASQEKMSPADQRKFEAAKNLVNTAYSSVGRALHGLKRAAGQMDSGDAMEDGRDFLRGGADATLIRAARQGLPVATAATQIPWVHPFSPDSILQNLQDAQIHIRAGTLDKDKGLVSALKAKISDVSAAAHRAGVSTETYLRNFMQYNEANEVTRQLGEVGPALRGVRKYVDTPSFTSEKDNPLLHPIEQARRHFRFVSLPNKLVLVKNVVAAALRALLKVSALLAVIALAVAAYKGYHSLSDGIGKLPEKAKKLMSDVGDKINPLAEDSSFGGVPGLIEGLVPG